MLTDGQAANFTCFRAHEEDYRQLTGHFASLCTLQLRDMTQLNTSSQDQDSRLGPFWKLPHQASPNKLGSRNALSNHNLAAKF